MSIPGYNDLFNISGVQERLDFLRSKIESDDLAPDEALALLSSLQKKLGHGKVTDSKVYQSYVTLMSFLQQKNPVVYNYVISTWNRRNKPSSAKVDEMDTTIDGSFEIDTKSQSSGAELENRSEAVNVTEVESYAADRPEEPGEPDDEETDSFQKIETPANNRPEEISGGETEEEENAFTDVNNKELDNSVDNKADDNIDEPDIEESKYEDKDQVAEEIEIETKESETDEEAVIDEGDDPPATTSEMGDITKEPGIEQEETEWPEVDQTQPEEMFDGLESENDPPAGEE